MAPRQSPELDAYAAALYERRNEGVLVPLRKLTVGEWHPLPKAGHKKVSRIVANDMKWNLVRVGMDLDFGVHMPYVKFLAYYGIETPEGILCDITPQQRLQDDYPFIRDLKSEDEYGEFIETYQISELFHCV